ncbi:FAD-dependent oxidoreductase [Streptomyces kanasensis]|uniref:FAD-dependent oxidoreductase n=1 Tax=Streptomyces kanasensis TaxID=936756 RepID=UPI0036F81C94
MKAAVVLGGSIAGLLAARVLSDHAEKVVILEPDSLAGSGPSRGAPHRQQLHALLTTGHAHFEQWFPGITKALTDGGARMGDGSAIQYYVDGVLRPAVSGTGMLGATRPFIEDHMRRRVLALPNVTLRTGRAHDLVFSGSRVSGVRFSSCEDDRAAGPVPGGRLDADLVVDAMGRSSRLGAWLLAHGWDQPPHTRLKVEIGYATAYFRRGDELDGLVVAHSSPGPGSGYRYRDAVEEPAAVTALEADRWGAVLVGYTDYRPSSDPEEFTARLLRSAPPIRTVAENCELVSGVATFHFRESIRRDFTKLGRFPGGLVAVGDAIASVNPIYGQGLTMAALQASSLSAYLRTGASPHKAAWGYFRRAGAVVNAAWQVSATTDLAQPHIAGARPCIYPLTRWVTDRVIQASVIDPAVNRAFMDVAHMRARPQTFSRPGVLLAASRALASQARRRTAVPEGSRTGGRTDGPTDARNERKYRTMDDGGRGLSFWSEANFKGEVHRAEIRSEGPVTLPFPAKRR